MAREQPVIAFVVMALASRAAADMSPSRREQETPAPRETELLSPPTGAKEASPVYAVGERVNYWSETHQQWMNAVVKQAHPDGNGGISYDLDVKRGAQASKIRRLSNPPAEAGTGGGGWQATAAAEHLLARNENGENFEELPMQFTVGEQVEYWSDTYQQWMPAEVRRVRDGGEAYDLSVKRGAQRHRIRPLRDAASSLAVEASAVASAAVAAAAAVANAASGQAGQSLAPLAGQQQQQDGDAMTALNMAGPADSSLSVPVTALGEPEQQPPENVPRTTFSGLQSLPENFDEGNSKRSPPRITPPTLVTKGSPNPPHSTLAPASKSAAPAWVASHSATSFSEAVPGRRSLTGVVGTQPPSPRGLSPNPSQACAATQANSAAEVAAAAPSARGEVRPQLQPLNGPEAIPHTRPAPSVTTVSGATQPQQLQASQQQQQWQSAGPTASTAPCEASNGSTNASMLPAPGAYPSGTAPANRSRDTPSDGSMSLKIANGVRTTPYSTVARQSHRVSEGGGTRGITYFMGTGLEFRRAQQLQQQQVQAADPIGASPASCSRPNTVSSTAPPPQTSSYPSYFGVPLELRELRVTAGSFNPVHGSVHAQLVQHLNLPANAHVEEMQGFRGGLNEGVWFMSDSRRATGVREELVLKLVRGHRITATILTEAENFLRMSQDHPGIIKDPSVAFPFMIFSCVTETGGKQHDLIVMRKVAGSRLAELIAHKWYGHQVPQLMHIFERVGEVLGEFHCRYKNSQHGDFQPSNIFYDDDRGEVTMIDVGGMGVPTTETDTQHFAKSLKMLSDAYGAQLATDGLRFFEQGYAKTGPGSRGVPG